MLALLWETNNQRRSNRDVGMKVWIKVEDEGEFIRIIYYVNPIINKPFVASTLKRKKNKKRWSIEGMLTKRNLKFTPIKQIVILNRLASFKIEDDKIRFDILGWPR